MFYETVLRCVYDCVTVYVLCYNCVTSTVFRWIQTNIYSRWTSALSPSWSGSLYISQLIRVSQPACSADTPGADCTARRRSIRKWIGRHCSRHTIVDTRRHAASLSFVTWHARLRSPRADRHAQWDAPGDTRRNQIKYISDARRRVGIWGAYRRPSDRLID